MRSVLSTLGGYVYRVILFSVLALFTAFTVQSAHAQTFTKTFTPNAIGPGGVSTATFTIFNNTGTPITSVAFTDTLPPAITIADPENNSLAACPSGGTPVLTASAGGSTITFADGEIGAGATCVITVDVTATTPGSHTNPAITLTSSAGTVSSSPTDLTVSVDRPAFSKSFSPDSISLGGRSTLTFTIDNSANAKDLSSLSFTDNFPAGMEIGDPSNLASTCGGPNPQLTAVTGSSSVSFSSFGILFPGFEVLLAGATCTISVDVVATSAGTLVNTTSELTSNDGSSGRATDALTVTTAPLLLTKEFTDDPVVAGNNVTVEFTIRNADRNFSATGVTFTDDLNAALAGLTYDSLLSNDCGGTVGGTTTTSINFSGGTLAPEATCTIRASLAVPAGAASGTYTNTTGAVSATVNGGPVTGNTASDDLFVLGVSNSPPTLTAVFTPGTATAGGTAVLEYTITNTSTSPATDITFLTDFLSIFPTASVTPGNGICGAGSTSTFTPLFNPPPPSSITPARLTLNGGTLAPAGSAGDSCTFSITLDVLATAPGGSVTQTTSDLDATVGTSVTSSGTSADLLINGGANLNFTKSFSGAAVPGGTVDLTFEIENPAGSVAVDSIAFTDDLNAMLAGTTVAMAGTNTCGGTPAGAGSGTFSYSAGTLAAGASCTVTVSLNIPAGAITGTYTNTTSDLNAVASGAATTIAPATADLTVAGMTFTKEFIDDPVIAGGTTTLRFTFDNTASTVDATSISFSDDINSVLPGTPDLSIITALPTPACGGTLSTIGANFLFFSGGAVTAGATCSLDVTLQVPGGIAGGTYVNTTSNLTADFGGTLAIVDPATDGLVVDSMQLQLTKEFTDDPVDPGNSVNLRFTLTNLSTTETVSAIAFTDDLDAALTGLAATGLPLAACGGTAAAIPSAGTIDFSGGTLAAGAQCQFDVSVSVPAGATPGDYTNTTSTIAGTAGGLPVDGDAASDVLTISDPTALTFTKTFDGPSVPGGTPRLTFTITNPGAGTVTGLSFSDDLDTVITGLVATNLPLSNVCGTGSTLSGTSLITLTGAELAPGGGTCSFDIDLLVPAGAAAGTYPNATSDLFAGGLSVAAPATADLTIEPPPTFAKVFAPDTILFGDVSTLTFTIDNSASALAASALDFTDNLPAAVTVATPANASTTCIGGTLTATAGSGVISYTGGTAGAGASCTVAVDVTSSTAGTHVNTTGDLTSSSGNSGMATDNLMVTDMPPVFSKAFAPNPINAGAVATLTFTINNNAAGVPATALDFTDNLPAAVTVATPANASTTCTGGTLTAASGASSISYTGGTVAANASCTVTADVTSSTPGAHVNTTDPLTSSLGDSGTATDTLNVDAVPPLFSKAYAPSTIFVDGTSVLTFTIDNSASAVAATTLDFTDNMPAATVVATPANASTTCTGGTLTATSGTSVVSYSAGSVAAGAVCTVQVDITSPTAGAHVNTTGDLTSSSGNSGTATDTLTVDLPPGSISIVKNTAPAAAGDGTFEFTSTDPDLDAISLTTVGNIATSTPVSKVAGVYTISEDVTAGWVLDSIACIGDTDNGSVIDLPNREVAIDLDNGETIVCTFTNIRDSDQVVKQTLEAIMDFMEKRADQMTANQPDLVSRLRDREKPGVAPLEFTGSGTLASSTSRFSTSLHKVKTWHSNLNGEYPSGTPKFDIWMQGFFSHTNTTSSKSHLGMLHFGADYLINPDLVVGGIVQLDWAGLDSSTTVAKTEGFGWMAGPYFVANPWQNIYIDGRVAYGQSYNDINPIGLYTDQFDTDRFMATLQITGDMSLGNLNVNPAAELIYFNERQQTYTDTLGNTIPSQSLEVGRLIFGPQFSYNMVLDNGATLTPTAKFEGIWDFHEKKSALGTGTIESIGGLRGRVDIGLGYTDPSGVTVNASGFYDGIGRSGFEAVGGKLDIRIPLQKTDQPNGDE